MADPANSIAERIAAVRRRITDACTQVNRSTDQVRLLAVSKRFPADVVRDAVAAGQHAFGENRVQELVPKAADLTDLGDGVQWHLVGSLQTNKVRDVVCVPRLCVVHSLDRERLADALSRHCSEFGRTLEVLIQVNATGEAQKHGVAPEDAERLAAHVLERCSELVLVGVMGMGPLAGDTAATFERVARVHENLRASFGLELPTLSLGMTADLELAIAAGSTLVRVGTGVFGPRPDH